MCSAERCAVEKSSTYVCGADADAVRVLYVQITTAQFCKKTNWLFLSMGKCRIGLCCIRTSQ